jgi:alkyldihydroxyacetonephosphate synthase
MDERNHRGTPASTSCFQGLKRHDERMRERSWWGWGWADQVVDGRELAALRARVGAFLPLTGELLPVPSMPALAPPRLAPPPGAGVRSDAAARAAHTHGKAYRDVIRNLRGELAHPPDFVWYPHDISEIERAMEFAVRVGAALIPYGGGTSVVGGVEYRDADRPAIALDISGMGRTLEVDRASLAVRVQGGTLGPALEDRLRPDGLTLRHFPQSFEFSTVGGWLATRAGGHFATGYTHIDDVVESIQIVTPSGVTESERVPSSGAGPAPDRLWLGSEGTLGVITSAWLRVRRRPTFRAAAAASFPSYPDGVSATRQIAQSGLLPANCRLLDPLESMLGAGEAGDASRLILGFESADHPVDGALARAVEICRDHGGVIDEDATGARSGAERSAAGTTDRSATADRWRGTFLRAPYLRDGLARLGVIVETFETSCTWSNFDRLHAAVMDAVAPAVATCRFTHVYPDGPAPYFTVYAAGRPGGEVEQWDAIKARGSQAVLDNGGTITHHHAVGRDHVPWYQPSPVYRSALRAVKHALDPHAVLNPGVLGL